MTLAVPLSLLGLLLGAEVPVILASGTLQKCLGITPGADRMKPGPSTEPFCQQLPGAGLYTQAGALFKAGNVSGAAKVLAEAAQAGNPPAQLRLAMLYESGTGVPRDLKAALSWYQRAAAAGEPASQAELGGYHEEADGVPENWGLAARLYRASAQQGWVKGQFALGHAYQFGIGVPQSRRDAIAWFKKAGAQGHAQASYFARWLADPANNIGFRNDAEHDQVIAGKLRFALGPADPAGITFHGSRERMSWLAGLGAQLNASEAQVKWQLRKDDYDKCVRNGRSDCLGPGARPAH